MFGQIFSQGQCGRIQSAYSIRLFLLMMKIFNKNVAVCILVITSLLKIASLIKGEAILNETDPLIQMPYSAVQWMVGVVEVLVVLMLYSQTVNAWKGCALGCLGASFLVYRIFDMLSPDIFYCICLGSLELFPALKSFQSTILTSVSLYLTVTGIKLICTYRAG